jgi:hypothetical protein
MLHLDEHGVPSHTINNGERVPVLSGGSARFLSEDEAKAYYEEDTAVRGMTAGELERVAECSRLRGGVDVWRDWEGFLAVWVPDDEVRKSLGMECMFSISTDGQIAHYDRNLPEYFPNLMLLQAAHRGEVKR